VDSNRPMASGRVMGRDVKRLASGRPVQHSPA
jgi:hypothetical protein